MQPKIFIATPVQGSHVYSRYCTSLFRMGRHLQERGIASEYFTVQASDISFQRDDLASTFLGRTEFSHLLFIDSDMEFDPELAFKLLSFGKDFVGTIYAKRKIDFGTFQRETANGRSFNEALAVSHNFIFPNDRAVDFTHDLCSTEWIGLGFTLIARQCFERIEAHSPPVLYPAPGEPNKLLKGFFRKFIEPNGVEVTEDISFCRRVRGAGIEVLSYHAAQVGHIGEFVYGAPFTEMLRAHGAKL